MSVANLLAYSSSLVVWLASSFVPRPVRPCGSRSLPLRVIGFCGRVAMRLALIAVVCVMLTPLEGKSGRFVCGRASRL